MAEVIVMPSGSDVEQVRSLSPAVAEAYGINLTTEYVDREKAMTIPAVRRGRQVVAGTLGSLPLVCMRVRGGKPPERVQRTLLSQPDPNLTLATTLTWTVDDLMFYGWALWRTLERDSFGFPTRAERVSPSRITQDASTGTVRIDGNVVNQRDLIIFTGPDEGILKHGARALKTALLLEEAVRRFARLDIPLGLIYDEESGMTPTEAQEWLDLWEAARIARNTGYLPRGFKYQNPGFNPEQIELGDARAFQSMEIARLLNLPASYVNAPTNDSLTYSTIETNRRELVDLTLAGFIVAIEQRLSMPDITPIGQTVSFDLARFLRGDTTAVINAGKVAVEAKLMTPDEVRVDWLNMPPLTREQRLELGLPTADTDEEQSDG